MIQSASRAFLAALVAGVAPASLANHDLLDGSTLNVVIDGIPVQYMLVRMDDPPAQPADAFLVTDLSRVRLQANHNYQLAPTTHVLTTPVKLPDNCTLNATGATIEYTGRDWSPAVSVNGVSGATLIGGTWSLGKLNFVVDSSQAKSFSLRNVHLLDGGGLMQARAASNILIENCTADVVERNFIYFGDAPNRDITIRKVKLIDGSRAESGIRIHRTTNLLIESCDVRATRGKKSALRLHDGANFLVKNSQFFGHVGAGPLAEGDGGRRWGIDLFINRAGKQTSDPKEADELRTARTRRERLALRADGVRFENVTIQGSVVLKAGVIGFDMRSGSITPIDGWRAFEQITKVYPESPQWRLPGDVLRPAPSGQLVGVTIRQNRPDLNAPIPLIDCYVEANQSEDLK